MFLTKICSGCTGPSRLKPVLWNTAISVEARLAREER